MTRIHIPLGRRVRGFIEGYIGHAVSIAAVTFALVTFSMFLKYCEPPLDAAELPKKLVVANTSSWTTGIPLFALPNATSAATVHVGDSGCSTKDVTLVPGGVDEVQTFDLLNLSNCGVGQYALLTPPAGAGSLSVLSFNDGVGHTSFDLPPIGTIDTTHAATAYPVVIDDRRGAWVNVFPTEQRTIRITLTDPRPDGTLTQSADFTVKPPVTQVQVPFKGRGTVTVSIPPTLICNLCFDPPPLYGFMTAGTPDGRDRAFPFGGQ